MHEDTDQAAWLLLLRTPGLGGRDLLALLEAHGDIRGVLDSIRSGKVAGLGERGRDWLRAPDKTRLAADADWLARPGHRLLCSTDADFPPQLERMPDPPAALFVQGDASLLLRPQVAVVGARSASGGGRRMAAAFARTLSEAGLVITSGLAQGIDAAAHEAALEASAGTVAVIGTGPDRVYPRRHAALTRAIAEQGVVVSEFVPGTGARPGHFPRRNRIIAGLSLGTLVVEAGVRSGSLITARLAAECGREVFALPGSIHHPMARGCHRLIREGACLVESAADILEALVPLARAQGADLAARLQAGTPSESSPPAVKTPKDPRRVRLLDALGYDPASVDELSDRSGLAVSELSPMLLDLELEGTVASQSGGRYQRLSGGGQQGG